MYSSTLLTRRAGQHLIQVYIFDETTNKGTVYKNANWPGEAMTLDPATGYYYYEVPKSSSISADEDDENQAASVLTFQLQPTQE